MPKKFTVNQCNLKYADKSLQRLTFLRTITQNIKHITNFTLGPLTEAWNAFTDSKSVGLSLTNLLEGWTRGPQGQQPLLERFLLRAHQSWPILRSQAFWLHLFQKSTSRSNEQTFNNFSTRIFFLLFNAQWPCILTIWPKARSQGCS